jgi:hypothetical protein
VNKLDGVALPQVEGPGAVATWSAEVGGAEIQAVALGKPVEVTELNSEREIVYSGPGAGGFVADLSSVPVRVRDEDGDEWVDVDVVVQAGVEEFNQFLIVHTPQEAADDRLQLIELPITTSRHHYRIGPTGRAFWLYFGWRVSSSTKYYSYDPVGFRPPSNYW